MPVEKHRVPVSGGIMSSYEVAAYSKSPVALLLLFLILVGDAGSQPRDSTTASICSLTSAELQSELDKSVFQFDQDMNGGWRALVQRGCTLQAAMLLDVYNLDDVRSENKGDNRGTLFFHAGQLYATAGASFIAIRRFYSSLDPGEDAEKEHVLSWNAYVLATIAFLKRDKEAVRFQREQIAIGPKTDGNKTNLRVVDGLLKCWDQSYKDAYQCRGN
jgi:hypothetical protein